MGNKNHDAAGKFSSADQAHVDRVVGVIAGTGPNEANRDRKDKLTQVAHEHTKVTPEDQRDWRKTGQAAYDEGHAHAQRGIGRRQGVYDQKNYDRGYFAGRGK